MTYFASCFLVGLLAALFIMRSSLRHSHMLADHELSGPKNFHARFVPGFGGLGVMLAIVRGVVIAQVNDARWRRRYACRLHWPSLPSWQVRLPQWRP